MPMTVQQKRGGSGFSLIEALIALVIIMVGLLGIAGLQALGVRNSAQAHIRTLVGMDAHSLASELRANSTYWSGPGAPANVTIAWNGTQVSISSATLPAAPASCGACTPAQSAAFGIHQWAQAVAGDLPSSTDATITQLATAGTSANAYAISVNWSENRMKGQGAVTTGSQTHSTSVVVKP